MSGRMIMRCISALIIVCLNSASGYAQTIVSVQAENDILQGTDRNYTNGVRASIAYQPGKDGSKLHELLYSLPVLPSEEDRRWVSISVGQAMFTPDNLNATGLLAEQRPYAGWSYIGFGVGVERRGAIDVIELDIGIIGPLSQADSVQRWWHARWGFEEPMGWAHQLKNEPAFLLNWQHAWRHRRLFSTAHLGADFSPHIGAALGTVQTHAAAGFTVRVGSDLSRDFGAPPRLQPSLPGSDYFSPDGGFGWYLFGGLEGRVIARNAFLDGNAFRDSHNVDRKTFLLELQFGAAVLIGNLRLALTHVIRTDEYRGQSGVHSFGSLSLSAAF